MEVDAGTVRAFIASLADLPPTDTSRERSRVMLEALQRPDLRYLVGTVVGPDAAAIARVARAILEAAAAPTAVLASEPAVAGKPLDEPLVARAGTLAAASGYQLSASRPDLGDPTRREMVVIMSLIAFAESNQRVTLLLDPEVDPLDPMHAVVPDLVVIGHVGRDQVDRALALVPDGRPAVAAPLDDAVREVVERLASERGIPLLLGGRDYAVDAAGETIAVRVGTERYEGLTPPPGTHPDELAAGIAAALALGVLGIRMREEWVIEGCRNMGG